MQEKAKYINNLGLSGVLLIGAKPHKNVPNDYALCCVYIRKTAYGQRIITNFNLKHCIVASDHRISARKRKIHQQSGPQWRFVNRCPTTLKRSK